MIRKSALRGLRMKTSCSEKYNKPVAASKGLEALFLDFFLDRRVLRRVIREDVADIFNKLQ